MRGGISRNSQVVGSEVKEKNSSILLLKGKVENDKYMYFLGKNRTAFALYLWSRQEHKTEDIWSQVKTEEVREERDEKDLVDLWRSGKLIVYDRDLWQRVTKNMDISDGEEQLRSGVKRALVVWGSLLKEKKNPPALARAWLENKMRYNVSIRDQVQHLLNEFREEYPYYRDTCLHCGAKGAELIGEIACTTDEERTTQRALRAELRLCHSCSQVSRFVRANDVNSIIQRKYGRCGEYSIAFASILMLLDIEIRWVYDVSDHVWLEAFIENRWIHLDPCEAALDTPLLYSENWGKVSSLVIAFEESYATDLTSLYYPDHESVSQLRSKLHLDPSLIETVLADYPALSSSTATTSSLDNNNNNTNRPSSSSSSSSSSAVLL